MKHKMPFFLYRGFQRASLFVSVLLFGALGFVGTSYANTFSAFDTTSTSIAPLNYEGGSSLVSQVQSFVETGDTVPCGGSNWRLYSLGGLDFGASSIDSTSGGIDQEMDVISGHTALATGTSYVGVPSYASIFSSYGSGTFMFFANSVSGSYCGTSTYPSTATLGTTYTFFSIDSSGVVANNVSNGSVILSAPSVATDFPSWSVTWSAVPRTYAKITVQYATSSALLGTCAEYPYGSGASETDCPPPNFYRDVGLVYTGTDARAGTQAITKAQAMTTGTTWYARAVIIDASGNNIVLSPVISFTIGAPTVASVIPATCETFDLACYMKQALYWAFVPSQDSLVQFQSLTLANSKPFSYLYDMGNLYNNVFVNTGSMDYSVGVDDGVFGHISFISASAISSVPYASTIKTILGYLLYFFTALTIYRIVMRVHDKGGQATT